MSKDDKSKTEEPVRPIAGDQITTMSDLMTAVQQEINDVKNGTLAESAARIVRGMRALQLKMAELGLQYARMMRGQKITGVPLLPGVTEEQK